MKKNWTINVTVLNEICDNLAEEYTEEHSLPYLPRIGEVMWTSSDCEKALDEKARNCWNVNKCENCPFMYGYKRDGGKISTGDHIYVSSIVYDVENKKILIDLTNKPIEK